MCGGGVGGGWMPEDHVQGISQVKVSVKKM